MLVRFYTVLLRFSVLSPVQVRGQVAGRVDGHAVVDRAGEELALPAAAAFRSHDGQHVHGRGLSVGPPRQLPSLCSGLFVVWSLGVATSESNLPLPGLCLCIPPSRSRKRTRAHLVRPRRRGVLGLEGLIRSLPGLRQLVHLQ